MQSCWLARNGTPSCLVFFAGWGMDPAPFRPLPLSGQDLLMYYDYRDLRGTEPADLLPPGYGRLTLLAWSMGVWVAAHLLAGQEQRLDAAVAVNGTLTPIDDRCGIPELAYAQMLAAFSPETLLTFYRSMFSEQTDQDRFLAHRPRRAEEEIREELAALRDQYRSSGPAPDLYQRCLVGSRDRVFTARVQVRSWGRERCRQVPAPHFPFYNLGWDNLLAGAEGT